MVVGIIQALPLPVALVETQLYDLFLKLLNWKDMSLASKRPDCITGRSPSIHLKTAMDAGPGCLPISG